MAVTYRVFNMLRWHRRGETGVKQSETGETRAVGRCRINVVSATVTVAEG